MKLTKDKDSQGIRWSIELSPSSDDSNISKPVQGNLDVEVLDDVIYPVEVSVDVTEGNYIEIVEPNKTIESASDQPANFQVILSENSGPWGRNEISYSDSAGHEGSTHFPIKSAEVVNLCHQILLPDSDTEDILSEIRYRYIDDGNHSLVYSDFRDYVRQSTGFAEYIEILGFLYENSPGEHTIKEDLINLFKNRIANSNGEYFATSSQDLKDKIKKVGDIPGLEDISEETGINEVYAIHHESLAERAVEAEKFQKAKQHINKAVEYYNDAERTEVTQPVILKQHAASGLLAESNSDFELAASHYEKAADDAENPEDKRIYEIWGQLSQAKYQLVSGNLKSAQEAIHEIPEEFEDVGLIDLRKLTILADLIEGLRDSNHGDARQILNDADVPYVPQQKVLQYDTDYSTAYSMLLTRQRLKQLNTEPENEEELLISIRDAITPGGTEGNENSASMSSANSEIESSTEETSDSQNEATAESFEREYAETRRAKRDPQFSRMIQRVYNGTCAVCGSQRQTPDGRPEVESAHIRPAADDGPDRANNGIALCQLHHWAFDNGWIAISDDYTVIVRDAPDVSGYDDFIQYQDSDLYLPDDENKQPNKDFLKYHREEHNFK
jgi:predicted restriction endonuclease